MESIGHFDEKSGKFIGRTNFKSGLINNVVALSAKEVAGVAGVAKSFNDSATKNVVNTSGVRISQEKDGIVIDVSIAIAHGYAAADVSYRVQENVINVAGSMIDKKIKTVNVKIVSVCVPHLEDLGEV